jgi:hypothetical protein
MMPLPSKERPTLSIGVPDLQGIAPKEQTTMTPLMPTLAKAKAQVFTRRV